MILTIAYIALIVGIVCVVAGYTVAPQAVRPGWGLLILALVLVLVSYLLPAVHTGRAALAVAGL